MSFSLPECQKLIWAVTAVASIAAFCAIGAVATLRVLRGATLSTVVLLDAGLIVLLMASISVFESGCRPGPVRLSAEALANVADWNGLQAYSSANCIGTWVSFPSGSAKLVDYSMPGDLLMLPREDQNIVVVGYGDGSEDVATDRNLAAARVRAVVRLARPAHVNVVATFVLGGPSEFREKDRSTAMILFGCPTLAPVPARGPS